MAMATVEVTKVPATFNVTLALTEKQAEAIVRTWRSEIGCTPATPYDEVLVALATELRKAGA